MRRSTWSLSTSVLEKAGESPETLERGDDLEEVLLFLDPDDQMCRDRVGQLAGVIDSDGGNHRVILQVVRELHVLLEQRHDAAYRPFHIAAGVRWPREHLDHDAVESLVFLPSTVRARSTPSTNTLTFPSGSLRLWTMLAMQPIM